MRKISFLVLFLTILNHTDLQASVRNGHSRFSVEPPFLLIAGHRGGSDSTLPENSLALFDSTLSRACNLPIALEFDIRENASGSLFLMHDPEVDRTTGGHGPITALSDSLINTLSLKDKHNRLTGYKVPSFPEVLMRYRNKGVILILDVKGDIFNRVIEQVKLFQMEDQCIMLTFNQKNLKLCIDMTSTMRISALVTSEEMWESVRSSGIPHDRLIVYVSDQTPEQVINRIRAEKTVIMTDMREAVTNNDKPFEPEYYRKIVSDLQPAILITDYPVFVSNQFCGN